MTSYNSLINALRRYTRRPYRSCYGHTYQSWSWSGRSPQYSSIHHTLKGGPVHYRDASYSRGRLG